MRMYVCMYCMHACTYTPTHMHVCVMHTQTHIQKMFVYKQLQIILPCVNIVTWIKEPVNVVVSTNTCSRLGGLTKWLLPM